MSDGGLPEYSGREVLVTGGSGFLGRVILRRLHDLGARAVNLDLVPAGLPGEDFAGGDVRDPGTAARALERLPGRDSRPALLLHLAGGNSAPRSLAEPYGTFDLNVRGTAAVLEAARTSPRPAEAVLMSTAAVYGAASGGGTVAEGAPLDPFSPYAASKAAAEAVAFSYDRSLGVPVTVARLFNVYGPGQPGDAVIPTVVRRMLAGGELRLGNTAAVRDFVCVDDAVDAFLALAAAKGASGKAVNIGTGRGASVAEVVEILREITGFEGPLTVDPSRLRDRDADVIIADTARLRELTGWSPAFDLARGLAAVVAAERGGSAS